ncbi:MAG: transposase [Desulfobulbaceae bacterium]|nr:transposase [Desulfobulbaceae bacterium]
MAFDECRINSPHSLKAIYGINHIPCDTSIREILDGMDPVNIRPAFTSAFAQLQRGKALERFEYMDNSYLICFDGTGIFSSNKLTSPSCMEKQASAGGTTLYMHMVGAAIVSPYFKEIIPLCPEIIKKQDEERKNDCERNAIKRLLKKLRKEHPHIKLIANEDSLASNAPHIRDLKDNNVHFILGIKQGDHKFLFNRVEKAASCGETNEFILQDDSNKDIMHYFKIINNVPLNKSNQDLLVNFMEYHEENLATGEVQYFCWITDFEITNENAMKIMRGGRARWKIENENFNTLKNQGYHLGHNYGLGKKHLSEVFVLLIIFAFLIDQIQQICCPLFKAVRKKFKSKIFFWEELRSLFKRVKAESMEIVYRTILKNIQLSISAEIIE